MWEKCYVVFEIVDREDGTENKLIAVYERQDAADTACDLLHLERRPAFVVTVPFKRAS